MVKTRSLDYYEKDIHIVKAYAHLSAAIIKSGVACNDKQFLESDWCVLLKDLCSLFEEHNSEQIQRIKEVKDDRFDSFS